MMRFQELVEEHERERKELAERLADVERLVEDQQQVIEYLQSLAPLRENGRIDWERGELRPLPSCSTSPILGLTRFWTSFLALAPI
jgi:hypothetical protein